MIHSSEQAFQTANYWDTSSGSKFIDVSLPILIGSAGTPCEMYYKGRTSDIIGEYVC